MVFSSVFFRFSGIISVNIWLVLKQFDTNVRFINAYMDWVVWKEQRNGSCVAHRSSYVAVFFFHRIPYFSYNSYFVRSGWVSLWL